MYAGDEVDRLIDLEPGRHHGDVRDEARLVHECRAIAKGLATQHRQLALVGREAEYGAQRRGLAGAVRSDETDDPPGLDRRSSTSSSATCDP